MTKPLGRYKVTLKTDTQVSSHHAQRNRVTPVKGRALSAKTKLALARVMRFVSLTAKILGQTSISHNSQGFLSSALAIVCLILTN